MDQEQSFLQAIYAAPEDDAVRLVYADWLEDQGQAARAEFIRVQIQRARTPEEDVAGREELRLRDWRLWLRHSDEWVAHFGKVGVSAEHFQRGFLHRAATSAKHFLN